VRASAPARPPGPGRDPVGLDRTARPPSRSGWNRSPRRSTWPGRGADGDRGQRRCGQPQHRRSVPLGRAALSGPGHLRGRAHLALALRPVRLDQPVHPATGAAAAQVGLPALPLRHVRRDRRARHRHLIPESWTPAIGIPEGACRWFSAAAGTLAAVLVIGEPVSAVLSRAGRAGPGGRRKSQGRDGGCRWRCRACGAGTCRS
jgi:hypothetical protein